MIKGKIVIIDDNQAVLKTLKLLLEGQFSKVVALPDPTLIPSLLAGDDVDVVLLDMNFGSGKLDGQDGLFWLNRIKNESHLAIPPMVVLITAFGDVQLAVESLKKGADDFVQKPWNNERLISILSDAVSRHQALKNGKGNDVEEDDAASAAKLVIRSLLKKYAAAYARPIPELTDDVFERLSQLCLAGELTRLQEVIERTMLFSSATTWTSSDINILDEVQTKNDVQTLEQMEKLFIGGVLKDTGHNLVAAAQQLGITRQTLYNKMKKYDIY